MIAQRIPGWDFLSEAHDVFTLPRVGTVNTDLVNTEYRRIGRFQCPAALAFGLGYGDAKELHSAVGRFYLDMQVAGPAVLDGYVRVVILDPQLTPLVVCWQGRSEDLRLGAADPGLRLVLEEKPEYWISQDFYLEIQAMSDGAAVTLVAALSAMRLSMTQARVRRSVG